MSAFLLFPVYQVLIDGLLEMTSDCTDQKVKEYFVAQFVQFCVVCIIVYDKEEKRLIGF